ncbi:MAG: N-glycosylase/DNA lyase [Candidatus Aenigmarchaeota archaeon]|nr:N-glycosylase/DNA lyase [Candidatus Aenigmarchaeota archaeon]
MNLESLKIFYGSKKDEIHSRLAEFSENGKNDEKIFLELCFCLCTPRSSAIKCDRIVRQLASNRLLFTANADQIKRYMDEISFPDEKSRYIEEARKVFLERKVDFREFFKRFLSPAGAREWFLRNVNGLGRKEASHFLRNIGMGKEFAILDVHILKNLKEFGVIEEIPARLDDKKYLEIEAKMKKFSDSAGIPMDELDLLLWSKETGFIFK